MRVAFFLALSLSACASAQIIPADKGIYTSPMGSFSCGGYPLGAEVRAQLGPHGGTIRIWDSIREMRFDLEEFDPVLDATTLHATRNALYDGYLTQNILPLIRTASPQATLLESKAVVLETPRTFINLPVFQSAILMPENQIVRGQIQYSDGKYMYTISVVERIKVEWPRERLLKAAYGQLFIGLGWCRFPPIKGIERSGT